MSLYKQPGSDVWHMYIRHRGRRIRRSTGERDKEKAQRYHDDYASRAWKEKQAGRTLEDALVLWLKEKPRGDSDLRNIKLIRRVFGPIPLIEINNAVCRELLAQKGPANYNRILAVVRSSLNLAVDSGWIEQAPKIKRRDEGTRSFIWLTQIQYTKLRLALPSHAQAMCDFAVSTGLRWQNVAYLRWDQVNLKARCAIVKAEDIKDRDTLAVPLNDDAIAVLEAQRGRDDEFVFVYGDPPRPVTSIKTALNSACVRAGVPRITFHDLRHTWASWHIQNGTTLKELQELGGWASLDMVAKYAHLAPGVHARVANNVSLGRPVSIREKA